MSLRLLVALACLALASCAKRQAPADAAIATRTLLLSNPAEPQTLDPHLVSANTEFDLVVAFFEGLCVLDEKTSLPQPAAAERWEASDDGLTYTFHLRAGLQWSDGTPLTARDFVASWRRALSPSLAAEYSYLLYPLKNAEAISSGREKDPAQLGAEALDDRTIRLHLERPTPYLPALTALPVWMPVPLHAIATHGAPDQRSTVWAQPARLITNGAFTLSEWTANARLVAAKNPRYWDAATVRLDRIEFRITESPEVDERNFRAGQVHITSAVPATKIETYRRDNPAALRIDPFLQAIFLRFNTTRPPFNDPRVRRAFSLAIDREAITEKALRGGETAAYSFTPANLAGYTATANVPTDRHEARRLLAEAGYPNGQNLPEIPLQVRNDSVQPRMAEVLQAQWRAELGANITISQLEQKTWVQNQQRLDYTLSSGGWIGDFVDPVTFLSLFLSTSGNNWTGWNNSEYDAILARAETQTKTESRYASFQQAETLLLGEAPVAPVFFGVRSYLIHPAVRGWEPSLLGQHQYKKVYLAAP